MSTLCIHPELDLNFSPVVNPSPRAFTSDQVAEYNENGFVSNIRLFEGDELKRLQAFCHADDGDMANTLAGHQTNPVVRDVVARPGTVAYLNDLLGLNVVCFVTQYICKPPNQTKGGSHHQDASFNQMDARGVVVWLAIEDADVENGCMWFIPGSHKRGLVACDAKHHVIDPQQYGQEIPCEVEAGCAVFMSDLLMHSSPPNRSATRIRPGLTATYAPAEVDPRRDDPTRTHVLCSGADVYGNWDTDPA